MKTLHFNDDYALLYLDDVDLKDKEIILKSKSFSLIFKRYFKTLKEKESVILRSIKGLNVDIITAFYIDLLRYELKTVLRRQNKVTKDHILPLYELTEGLYDYWRKFERFAFLNGDTHDVEDLLKLNHDFNDAVIVTYRTISQKLLGSNFHVYRQLPAGISAAMLYRSYKLSHLKDYKAIDGIPFITKMVTSPPFIINSKSNSRKGTFQPLTFSYNPISKLKLNKSDFAAFPIYVGPLLAFVYMHRDFLHHGIALSNLFEFADYSAFKDAKPNLIYVFGVEEEMFDSKFYHDTVNDIYLGFVMKSGENDYFGYLKKMLLTLHNLYMINHDYLPIHGAMVEITLKPNIKKNVVIVGDSGAGKSETLEALRQIGSHDIQDIKVIFDDMGTFKLNNNQVVANGTEIGAFVRLDDLEQGYAYQIMDRALFLNPALINSRVVIPLSRYQYIIEDHPIDMVLYANNYEEKQGIRIFKKPEEAMSVFKKGVRMAKGTTNEVGLTQTYFANPFGPLQMRAKTDQLIPHYFKALHASGVILGEIYTNLAVPNEELRGPSNAAIALLKSLEE
ncbi:MAG: phosphoenolpyruvate carboxykinase [Bacilli bacterium]